MVWAGLGEKRLRYKSKYILKFGVLPIWKMKSNISSIRGLSLEGLSL